MKQPALKRPSIVNRPSRLLGTVFNQKYKGVLEIRTRNRHSCRFYPHVKAQKYFRERLLLDEEFECIVGQFKPLRGKSVCHDFYAILWIAMSEYKNYLMASALPWQQQKFEKKWATIPAQTVNSPEYKELRQYIHMPYRQIDHNGTKCYYFPTYVFFKIKNITEFDFDSLSANINGVLIIHIRVDYKDHFSPNLKDQDETQVREALQKLFKFKFKSKDEKKKSQLSGSKSIQTGPKIEDSKEQKEQQGEIGLKKYLYIQFNRDEPLRLPSKRIFEGQIKQDIDNKAQQGTIIKWTIRKSFTIALSPGTLWQDLIAPFNLLNFKLTLGFEDVDIQLQKDQMVKFKFNCMKRVGNETSHQKRRIFEQLNFTDDGSLGEYDLAETFLNVSCEKYLSKVTSDSSSKYRSYKVVTFTIPFYKYPIMDALTIFIPLILITILTLFTFVQGPDMNDKIGNIATLMIVYVGLMPVINDSLPPTTKITIIDIVLYCQLGISVLCLIRGYMIKDYDAAQFNDYKVWQDGVFIFSVVVAIITSLILFLLLVYYCYMKANKYNLQEKDVDESDRKLNHWVSPHLYQQARNLKTQISKIKKERENIENSMIQVQREPINSEVEQDIRRSHTVPYKGI